MNKQGDVKIHVIFKTMHKKQSGNWFCVKYKYEP